MNCSSCTPQTCECVPPMNVGDVFPFSWESAPCSCPAEKWNGLQSVSVQVIDCSMGGVLVMCERCEMRWVYDPADDRARINGAYGW